MNLEPRYQRAATASVRVQQFVEVPRCGAHVKGGQCVRDQRYAGPDAGTYLVEGEVVWLCTQHARIAWREGWRRFAPKAGTR